jgi:hypothetical protein
VTSSGLYFRNSCAARSYSDVFVLLMTRPPLRFLLGSIGTLLSVF